jgi:hypothetical protein
MVRVQRFWTNPQAALFASPYRVTVWRGSNGIGKTVALAELVRRALYGLLPWQTPGRGYVVILAGNTWSQLGETLGHFWSLVDRRTFRKGVRFESGGMKGQRLHVYDCVAGPAKGSQLRLGTFDAENLAGPRADVVISDEPLPETVYSELWPRLFGRDGRMYMGFTVTMRTSSKVEYLRKMIEDASQPWIGEIHTPLTIDAVTPRGAAIEVPWIGPREIDQFVSGLSELERDMRTGNSWSPRRESAYFSAFGPHLVKPVGLLEGWRVGVGIDHGSKPGAQRAILVAVDGRSLGSMVYVIDEYRGEGRTNTEQDAAGILAMLHRQGLGIEHVDLWVGDRAHEGYSGGGRKSNKRLMASIASELGYDLRSTGWIEKLPEPLRRMQPPRKYDGMVWEHCEVIHRLMVGSSPRIFFAPGTVHIQRDLENWQGNKTDPSKDGIDALRYIVVPMVDRHDHRQAA